MDIDSKSNQENLIDEVTAAFSKPCDHCVTVDTQAESITEQVDVTPIVIDDGPVVVKIPVIIAETSITIPVEATITLDQTVMEIKRIKKNVFLTQSRLIPFSQESYKCTGVLFVSGFVRKNIEYATQNCIVGTGDAVCGDIRHCTVQVPFNFSTRVTFLRPPVFEENTTPSEIEFFTDKLVGYDDCADTIIGGNPCDQNFFSSEIFNEKPYVELVKADVTEIDIFTNSISSCERTTERMFTQLTEKVVVNLTLKVLQKQQIGVTSV